MSDYYKGNPGKQPRDCGRIHPQPSCLCVLCEVYSRFLAIQEDGLALSHALWKYNYGGRGT